MAEQEYGRTLIAHKVDQLASSEPQRLWARQARTTNLKDGFHDITYSLLKKAIDRAAWHLEKELGKGRDYQPLAFIGQPFDIRYQILTLAAIKAGWTIFSPSPRNSLEAHLSLLNAIKCEIFLVDSTPDPVIKEIQKEKKMRLIQVPTVEELLSGDAVDHYPYNATFEEERSKPGVILHTSGSTGIPKPIVCAQSSFTMLDAFHRSPLKSRLWVDHLAGFHIFIPFPHFHSLATLYSTTMGIYWDFVNIFGPPHGSITPKIADEYIQNVKMDMATFPPSLWKDMASSETYVEHLKNVKYISSGGGPMIPKVVATLSKVTKFHNAIGTTEAGHYPMLLGISDEWEYMGFDPLAGIKFEEVSEGRSESVFVRDDKNRDFQTIFDTFPDKDTYHTSDLWEQHPTKPEYWRHRGRLDDVIVFSNGEKLNPTSFEGDLTFAPEVKGAVVFGANHFEAGVLVEPEDGEDPAKLTDKIWPRIRKLNEKTVSHGRISKDMILIASPEKPFPRAGKGTIQKKGLLKLYDDEIEALYASQEQGDDGAKASGVNVIDAIRDWIADTTGLPRPKADEDLFESELGFDSLMVSRLSRELGRLTGHKVETATVYANPNITQLAAAIGAGETSKEEAPQASREDYMTEVLEKYASTLPINGRAWKPHPAEGLTVAVSGTTGSLGAYMLESLLRRPNVQKVIALNRKSDAKKHQVETLSRYGLIADLNRVDFYQVDVSKPRLGLDIKLYRELLQEVDLFVHNAWHVDFRHSLQTFEKVHVYGVRQVIDFCSNSTKNASLFFVSSINTIMRWQPTEGTKIANGHPMFPEQQTADWKTSMPMGYSESKHVAENLLVRAAAESGLNVGIVRISQVAGPVQQGVKGEWNNHEWAPSILQASVKMDLFPETLGTAETVDWIPVDAHADVVVDFAQDTLSQQQQGNNEVKWYHTANPKTTTWAELLPAALKYGTSSVKTVPLTDWIKTLKEKLATDDEKFTKLPAAQLLDTFDAMANTPLEQVIKLDTTKSRQASETLRGLDAVQPEWMDLWMQQWNF